MDQPGYTDTDKGLEKIRKEMAALGEFRVKAGIVKGSGDIEGVDIAQYAAWNEYGVKGPPYSENGGGVWFIPPRPFIRGWIAQDEAKIRETIDKLFKEVSEGKMTAKRALGRLGQFAQDGIKRYIKSGSFTPNAERTKKMKKSSKPLIDTGTMRNTVRYAVIGANESVEGPVEG